MLRIIYTFFFLLTLCRLYAQEQDYIEKDFVETRDFNFKESLLFIRSAAIVPNVMANPGFRHSFKGIYEVNLSLNIRVASGFSLGVGLKNTLISTQERIQNVDIRMQLYTAFVRMGYTRYHSEKTYSALAINMGYNNSFYTNVVSIYSPIITKQYNSLVFEPEYSINFAVEENFTIGIFVSYAFFATPFEAKNIAMQDYSNQSTLGNTQANGMLNVGFCFHVGMGTKFKPDFQN
jgi:hypothetical protein